MAQSIELNIEDLANGWLKSYKLNYKLEQESLNSEIDKALDDYFQKVEEKAEIVQIQNYYYKIKT
jgi:hypothetical protein